MDYKKIIKSQKLRFAILNSLKWIPDKAMIKMQYRIKLGRKLNLKNPQRFTEKIQWYKLYYRNPIMVKCVDKFDVREYIDKKGYSKLLNKCYGVYNSVNEIDFDKLPRRFVIKDTLGGGSNSVIVVNDKDSLDSLSLKNSIDKWTKISTKSKSFGREWTYDKKKHRIIIEKYLEQNDGDLSDYKFFCFNGKVQYFYVRSDYSKIHDNGKMAFYNREKKWLKNVGMDYCDISDKKLNLPFNIDKMILIAEDLSKDFPHVRVDLYNLDGKILFGELTFFNASGYMKFLPDDFDYEIGKEWIVQ